MRTNNFKAQAFYMKWTPSQDTPVRYDDSSSSIDLWNGGSRQCGCQGRSGGNDQGLVTLLSQLIEQLLQQNGQGTGGGFPTPGGPPIPGNGPLVTGNQGPFDPNLMGSYGGNAAVNFQQLGAQNPQAAANATVQYTNPNNPKFADALGYSAQDIRRFDRNGDQALDSREITSIYNGDQGKANRMLRALDVNRDGKVDVVENAARVLAEDSPSIVEGRFGRPGSADGRITPNERARFERAVDQNPNLVREVLGQTIRRFDLPGRLREGQRQNPEVFGNPSRSTGGRNLLQLLLQLLQRRDQYGL